MKCFENVLNLANKDYNIYKSEAQLFKQKNINEYRVSTKLIINLIKGSNRKNLNKIF